MDQKEFDLSDFPTKAMVLGGAASGKSAFGENLVIGQKVPKTYLATAQAFDAEMAAKINAHKEIRENAGWTTVEEPLHIAQILSSAKTGEAILLDCATMWLSNVLLDERSVDAEIKEFVNAVATSPALVTVVTNEVGQGVVPDTPLGRQFREHQGALNIQLAATCDLVVQVVAGLPNVLKGTLPESVS